MTKPQERELSKPYTGGLTPAQASAAIQAARLAALDLVDSAEILHNLKRFAHSAALATLAIEEVAKRELIMRILLDFPEDSRAALWKAYRRHRSKGARLNPGIEGRIRAQHPEISAEEARRIGDLGPTPEELDFAKLRAIYSDCLESKTGAFVHCPVAVEWREISWHRLCEAQALASSMRDYPAAELEIWLSYAKDAQGRGEPFKTLLKPLHAELLERGFITESQWRVLLEELERDNGEEDA